MSANIVIFGVPRTGSSIAAQILQALGWRFFPDANWGGESEGMIAIQQRMASPQTASFERAKFDASAARRLLTTASSPWLVKDLTLSYTMDLWLPLMEEASGGLPLIGVMITRDPREVAISWRRRVHLTKGGMYIRPDGEVATKNENLTLDEWLAHAERAYQQFPGLKFRIDFRQLKRAAKLFDTKKIESRLPAREAGPPNQAAAAHFMTALE